MRIHFQCPLNGHAMVLTEANRNQPHYFDVRACNAEVDEQYTLEQTADAVRWADLATIELSDAPTGDIAYAVKRLRKMGANL